MKMYHISKVDLGILTTLTPKIPSAMGLTECKITKRVCFSPSLRKAIYGQLGCRVSTIEDALKEYLPVNPSVYVTYKKLYTPLGISDYPITGEQWSLEDISVKRIGYLDLEYMLMYGNIRTTPNRLNGITERDIIIFKNCHSKYYKYIL